MSEIPVLEEYDLIVIGAGSAGSALAASVAEQSDRTVLLLEAGTAYRRVEDLPEEISDPSIMSVSMPGHPHNWSLKATVDGASIPAARGKVLGGTGSINGASFLRALPADFTRWQAAGLSGWSYEEVLPYYKQIENDHDFADEYHGSDGPIQVRREPHDRAPEFSDAFTTSCERMGFSCVADKNGLINDGVGAIPMNVWKGRRVSSAVAYLLSGADRPNLTVMGDSTVRRVIFDGNRVVGVEILEGGQLRVIRAPEVVLSAGTLLSPQLLMISGVGPAGDLRRSHIPVVHDLPGVGSAVANHVELMGSYKVRGGMPRVPGRGTLSVGLHWTSASGAHHSDLEILPFLNSLSQMTQSSRSVMQRPLRTLMGLKGASLGRLIAQARSRNELLLALTLLQPEGRGAVRLNPANPSGPPLVSYSGAEVMDDLLRLRELVRTSAELFASGPLRSLGTQLSIGTAAELKSDALVDEWIKGHLFASGHPTSSCPMGAEDDPHAVVDAQCRVYGVEGLRVADASVLPDSPSRGPNPTAVMLGVRVADFIAPR